MTRPLALPMARRKRTTRLAAVAAAMLVAALLPFIWNAWAHAATVFSTTVVNQGNGNCAGVPNGASTAALQLTQAGCSGAAAQSFTFTPVSGTTNTYTIGTLTGGSCVDISGRSTSDNAAVIQYPCNSQTNQQFTLTAVTVSGASNTFNVAAVHSGKCIVPSGDGSAANTALVQLPCTTATSRVWRLAGFSAGSSPTPTASRTATPSPTPTAGGTTGPPPVPGTPGTWTAVPVNPFNGGAGTFMWLLTDGSILSNGSDLHQWVKLVPNANGDYTKGTWQQLATSPYGVGAAQEQILPDGRFYQAGGEFIYQWPSGSSANDHDGVQIYNPLTNTWTLGQSGLYGNLWDTGTAHLRDGRILASDQRSASTQIFNPSSNSWTAGPSRPAPAAEDGWIPLSDGSVVSISAGGTYRYDPNANAWHTAARPPSTYASGSVDTSMVTLMYDGRILAMGHNTSVIYTPGATASDAGSWAQGPGIPQGSFVDDVYTTPEPNGRVIYDSVRCSWVTNECGSASGALINEFDPATNTMSTISSPPDPSGAPVNFINLPNGQVLAAAGSRNWVYTPIGSPKDAWRPTISSVTASGSNYHLTGTQLSGLVSVGEDDYQNPQNYPIVSLRDTSGHVFFARTFNFSSMSASKPGESQSTDFTLPSGLAHGTYTLYVASCGVSSNGISFTF